MGEFVQSFNTTPYVVMTNLKSNEGLISLILNMFSGLLPGFIKTNLNIMNPGEIIAINIGRGYGLGFNVITESFYFGGFSFLLFSPIILFIIFEGFTAMLLKLKFAGYGLLLILISYLRLVIREGMTTYLLVVVYIFIFYFWIMNFKSSSHFFLASKYK